MYIYLTPLWWRHQMEKFSALLAICAGNSPVAGEFPAQRPVTRSFDVFFHLRLNKRFWLLETPLCPLWRHCNDTCESYCLPWCSECQVIMHITQMLSTQKILIFTSVKLTYHLFTNLNFKNRPRWGYHAIKNVINSINSTAKLSTNNHRQADPRIFWVYSPRQITVCIAQAYYCLCITVTS